MEEQKQWWQSKTMWAGIVTLAIGILGTTGLASLEGEQDVLVEKIMQIVTAVAGFIAIYGRITAKTTISKKNSGAKILILFVLLPVVGCSQVQMSPAYQQELYMSNVLVQSLNADCQAGDPNACKEGLNESAQILQLLVDAVEGRAPIEGETQ